MQVLKRLGDDPSWRATLADLGRLGWVLSLVWLALAAFMLLAQRYLGWRLAAGLIGGAGALFTIAIVFAVAAGLVADGLERRLGGRRRR